MTEFQPEKLFLNSTLRAQIGISKRISAHRKPLLTRRSLGEGGYDAC